MTNRLNSKTSLVGGYFFVIATGFSFAITENEVEARITEVFASAEQIFSKDPTGLEAQKFLNKSRLIIDTIQPYFYGVPGALHEHSEARQIRVEQVEGWLNVYEPFFIRLIGTLSSPTTNSNAIIDYVKFTKPSPQIKSALLKVAQSESARPDNAAAAYDGVFYLQLDDAKTREKIVASMEWLDERHARAILAAKIRNMSAILWATPEMLNYWRNSLLVSYSPENFPLRGGAEKLDTHYRWAASALAYFGKMDNDLAELARKRAGEIMNAGGHQRTIEKLIFAAEVLEGTRPPTIATNWKGQLLGMSTTAVSPERLQVKIEASIIENAATKKKGIPNRQDLTTTAKKSKILPPWVLVIGVVGLLGILVTLLRRSKKS